MNEMTKELLQHMLHHGEQAQAGLAITKALESSSVEIPRDILIEFMKAVTAAQLNMASLAALMLDACEKESAQDVVSRLIGEEPTP